MLLHIYKFLKIIYMIIIIDISNINYFFQILNTYSATTVLPADVCAETKTD